jgi:hypothetical protein
MITSLPQNKESILKIIINKYVTKLEINCCKKLFLFWSSDGLNSSIITPTMQSCFLCSLNKDSLRSSNNILMQETTVMPIGVSLKE